MLAAAASIASSSRPGDGYRYTLTVATVLQPHDGLHLAEWLEYHSLPEIGVEHFYLYDNFAAGDSEALGQVVAPYISAGLVTMLHVSGLGPIPKRLSCADGFSKARGAHGCSHKLSFPQQAAAMRSATLAYAKVSRWMLWLDVDEFASRQGCLAESKHGSSNTSDTNMARYLRQLEAANPRLGAVQLPDAIMVPRQMEAARGLVVESASWAIKAPRYDPSVCVARTTEHGRQAGETNGGGLKCRAQLWHYDLPLVWPMGMENATNDHARRGSWAGIAAALRTAAGESLTAASQLYSPTQPFESGSGWVPKVAVRPEAVNTARWTSVHQPPLLSGWGYLEDSGRRSADGAASVLHFRYRDYEESWGERAPRAGASNGPALKPKRHTLKHRAARFNRGQGRAARVPCNSLAGHSAKIRLALHNRFSGSAQQRLLAWAWVHSSAMAHPPSSDQADLTHRVAVFSSCSWAPQTASSRALLDWEYSRWRGTPTSLEMYISQRSGAGVDAARNADFFLGTDGLMVMDRCWAPRMVCQLQLDRGPALQVPRGTPTAASLTRGKYLVVLGPAAAVGAGSPVSFASLLEGYLSTDGAPPFVVNLARSGAGPSTYLRASWPRVSPLLAQAGAVVIVLSGGRTSSQAAISKLKRKRVDVTRLSEKRLVTESLNLARAEYLEMAKRIARAAAQFSNGKATVVRPAVFLVYLSARPFASSIGGRPQAATEFPEWITPHFVVPLARMINATAIDASAPFDERRPLITSLCATSCPDVDSGARLCGAEEARVDACGARAAQPNHSLSVAYCHAARRRSSATGADADDFQLCPSACESVMAKDLPPLEAHRTAARELVDPLRAVFGMPQGGDAFLD